MVIGVRSFETGYWLASRPGRCIPWEKASVIHPLEGCVSTRTGLKALEAQNNLLPPPGIELQFLGRVGTKQISRQIEDSEEGH